MLVVAADLSYSSLDVNCCAADNCSRSLLFSRLLEWVAKFSQQVKWLVCNSELY